MTAADPPPAPGGARSTADAAATPVPVGRRRTLGLLTGIAAAVVALDLLTKLLVVAHVQPGVPQRILGGLVYLSLFRNAGAAFSQGTGLTWVLSLIVIAVVVFIVRLAPRLRSTPWAVCLGLILGGALGNLLDRLFRSPGFLRGHVVDFVSLFGPNGEHFAIFNLADSAITCGGVVLVVTALLGIEMDGRRTRTARRGTVDPVDLDAGAGSAGPAGPRAGDADGVPAGPADTTAGQGPAGG